jgi:TRAP-type mannitol/chloroaromatic compound transport system permease small subunit
MLEKLCHFIDQSNANLGKLVAYGTLLMAVLMFAVVVLRYGFNVGWIAMQESITYFHAAVFLLGSAYTFQQNAHVRVDVFYRRFSEKRKMQVDLLGGVLFMLPISIFLTYHLWSFVADSWKVFETSPEPGGLPFVYILKSLLLLFSFTLCLQAISEILKKSLGLMTYKEAQ